MGLGFRASGNIGNVCIVAKTVAWEPYMGDSKIWEALTKGDESREFCNEVKGTPILTCIFCTTRHIWLRSQVGVWR